VLGFAFGPFLGFFQLAPALGGEVGFLELLDGIADGLGGFAVAFLGLLPGGPEKGEQQGAEVKLCIVDGWFALHVDFRVLVVGAFNEADDHADGKTDGQRLHHRGDGVVFNIVQDAACPGLLRCGWFVGRHSVHRSDFAFHGLFALLFRYRHDRENTHAMARIIDTWSRWTRERRTLGRALAAWIFLQCGAVAGTPGLRALLTGGGPDKENNTAQIEEHLRFVTSLVPASPGRIVLFADGKPKSRSLSYTDSTHLTEGQRALDVLLPNDGLGAKVLTRVPDVGAPLDGASRLPSIESGFSRLASMSGRTPVLIYFAGHGSVTQNKAKTSVYNLWGDEDLDPATLVREIDTLPRRVPVTLVMAQCFSGGFANVLFKKANPDLGLSDRLVTGFFSAESDREAAGCGTETNSPDYQDFSSYFFGALSGRDRLGHEITGADYDGDGKVSCHEAYCYAMIHDESIDTPVCTSLIFLRRYADMADSEIFACPWHKVVEAATPAQRAVLEALSAKLGVDGEDRLLAAYDRLMFADPIGQPAQIQAFRETQDRLNAMRMERLHALFVKWPDLRWRDSKGYNKAARGAATDLGKEDARCQEIIRLGDAYFRADDALDNEEALLVRFTDVAEAVLRARYLRDEKGNADTKARFEALWKAEQQPLPLAAPAQ